MILTITLNPLLERRIFFPSINLGDNYRDTATEFNVGGKGINVSRQLKSLGIDSLAMTILGGENGKKIRALLEKEGLKSTAVKTNSNARDAVILFEEEADRVTSLISPNAEISEEEAKEFISKMDKIIQNCEIVVLSGSSPCKATDKIFPEAISIANKYDKISVLDTYGQHLTQCIEQTPTVIHNNLKEIEDSLQVEFTNEEKIFSFLDWIYGKGIKQAYLTSGGGKVYSSKFDFHFTAQPPTVIVKDATGSGDAFTTGIVYGHYKDLIYSDALRFAIALGSINTTTFDVCSVNLDEAEELKAGIEIFEIGKKMKTLDVP